MYTLKTNFSSSLITFSVQNAFNMIKIISVARYVFLLTGILGLVTGISLDDILFFSIAIALHKLTSPHVGYTINQFKHYQSSEDFIPINKLLIYQSDKKLKEDESNEIKNVLSEQSKIKMAEIMSLTNKITVFDAVNLLLFDFQYGEYASRVVDGEIENKPND
ncbi:MAG: hypothetical protein QM500_12240 [Methylococcales bacterium]